MPSPEIKLIGFVRRFPHYRQEMTLDRNVATPDGCQLRYQKGFPKDSDW